MARTGLMGSLKLVANDNSIFSCGAGNPGPIVGSRAVGMIGELGWLP